MKRVFFLIIIVSLPVLLFAQSINTTIKKVDSAFVIKSVTSTPLASFLQKNKYLNYANPPMAMPSPVRQYSNKQTVFFYLLTGLALIVALLKFFFNQYFTNLFRVFFNSSLRQSQLTDQLQQAKLISLYFNLFFFLVTGIYIFYILQFFNKIPNQNTFKTIGLSTTAIALLYIGKYQILKFTGWITGNNEPVNIYVFIIFLNNKILALFLFPLIILIAFATNPILNIAVYGSLFLVVILFLLRFFRAFGLLQGKIKINQFHFYLYLIGIEVMPILLIYKVLLILLNKNL